MSETDKLEQEARNAEVLAALHQWEEDSGGLASPTEGNAFIDGFVTGRADERRKVIEECCKLLCNDCARGDVPKWYGEILGHNESGLSCGATLIRRHFKLPELPEVVSVNPGQFLEKIKAR